MLIIKIVCNLMTRLKGENLFAKCDSSPNVIHHICYNVVNVFLFKVLTIT